MIKTSQNIILLSATILFLTSCSKETETVDTEASETTALDEAVSGNDEEAQAAALSIREAAAEAVKIIEADAQLEISNLPPLENPTESDDNITIEEK